MPKKVDKRRPIHRDNAQVSVFLERQVVHPVAKEMAAELGLSLSQWVAELVMRAIEKRKVA